MDTEHKVMEAIDKQLEKLNYINARVTVVLPNKIINVNYTKSKPVMGFTDKGD